MSVRREVRAGADGAGATLRGLKRNAAVVLGNSVTTEDAEDGKALRGALEDAERIVRAHAAWALAQRSARRIAGSLTSACDGESR